MSLKIIKMTTQFGLINCSLFLLFCVINGVVTSEVYCKSTDIRNEAKNLMSLENCTVIAGSLTIVLIESENGTEFEKYSFPKLK